MTNSSTLVDETTIKNCHLSGNASVEPIVATTVGVSSDTELPLPSALRNNSTTSSNSAVQCSVTIDLAGPQKKTQIRNVAETVCPQLLECYDDNKTASSSDLTVTSLSGGLSNELWIVRNPISSMACLVRIHPANTMVDRTIERRLVTWLPQPLAPRVYGLFRNGRVEELYDNAKPLHSSTMASHATDIARLLGHMHRLDVDATAVFENTATIRQDGGTWRTLLEHWLSQTRQAPDSVRREYKWLSEQLKQRRCDTVDWSSDAVVLSLPVDMVAKAFCSEIVLCHMDGQSLNFLESPIAAGSTSSGVTELKLIDFEYASLNPRGCDLANTWNEFCDMNGVCANYESEFPSRDVQHRFLTAYIKEAGLSSLLCNSNQSYKTDDLLDALGMEIGRYALVSHLLWSLWGWIQLEDDTVQIEFRYAEYAAHRMEGYAFAKKRFWKEEMLMYD